MRSVRENKIHESLMWRKAIYRAFTETSSKDDFRVRCQGIHDVYIAAFEMRDMEGSITFLLDLEKELEEIINEADTLLEAYIKECKIREQKDKEDEKYYGNN